MRRTAIAAMCALVLVISAACSGGSTSPDGSGQNPNLVVGATVEPETLDPSATDAAAVPQVLLYNVYETLIKVDTEGEFQPLLASEWGVSDDRLTYTFTLDEAAAFPGGEPVTAEDVVWSVDRFQTGDNVATQAQLSVLEKVEATDEQTVVFTLSRPSNQWLYSMSSTAGIVFDSQTAGDLATAPAGSGPYALAQWTKGSELELERNDEYWGEAAWFTSTTFRYFPDPNAMNTAMLSGGLDIISNLQAPQALDQFSDGSKYSVIDGTTNGEVVMSFNHESGPLKDKRVRQAINHAIDRQALLDTVWNGKGTLIGSMVPPTDPWYEDLADTYPYDPEKARELLADAGYADGLDLRLRVPTIPYATGSAQFVASQLAEVGINATVDELEFPARWLDVVFTQADYDMSIVSHVEARDIVKYGDQSYYWRYDNPEVVDLLADADSGTPEEQIAAMKEVARTLADDAAADWLFLLPNLVITTSDIVGVPENATTLSFDLTGISRNG